MPVTKYLGTIATQDSDDISITGGSITGITDIAVAHGGTGASTASAAASNLGLGTEDTVEFTSLGVGVTPAAYNKVQILGTWSSIYSRGLSILGADLAVDANASNYGLCMHADYTNANIASGVTDGGYRYAILGDALIGDADFEGTLTSLGGLYFRAGITSGTGTVTNSYSLRIARFGQTGTVTNSYGLYINAPTTGGTLTNQWAMYIADPELSYFAGTVSALVIVDRTKGYSGDALEELKKVKNKGNSIDHSTLPEFARTKVKSKDKDDNTIEEDGRDLGAMISVLTVAVQQLTNRLEILEAK